jgi:hypothetical protein
MIRIAALTCLIALAPIAAAQEALHPERESETTARQVMAQVIADAMVPVSQASYGRDWDAVSIRISRLMHWHLAPPDTAPASARGIRRNGWIAASGEQIGVSAYGTGTVESLTFGLSPTFSAQRPEADESDADDSDSGESGTDGPDKRENLFAALTAIGVTVTPAEARPSFADKGSAAWNLAAEGREDAMLIRSTLCTPEGSAQARMCGATYELVLKK